MITLFCFVLFSLVMFLFFRFIKYISHQFFQRQNRQFQQIQLLNQSFKIDIKRSLQITPMNQRSSHFTLGNTPAPYSSIYKKDFIQKESFKRQHQSQNPFRGSSLQQPKNYSNFQTTNKQMLPNWGKVEYAKLDPSKLQNLKGHHFTLGNYNPQILSTSHKLFYNHKPLNQEASNKQQESKSKIRAHNHDFKEQNWTNFQSSYKKQFAKYQQIPNQNPASKLQKKQNKAAIVLGNHNVPIISTSAVQFRQKKIESGHQSHLAMKQTQQKTNNLVLNHGTVSNQPMETMNQHYFDRKPIQTNNLPEQTIKELRSTHFNLGQSKLNYKTQSKLYQSYNNQSLNQTNTQMPKYESGTWVDKSAKFTAKSTNQQQFHKREVKPYKKPQINQKQGFQLGTFKTTYDTQFKTNFAHKDPKDARLPHAKKNDNIVIGMDKGSYVSQQKANYKSRNMSHTQTDCFAIKQKNTGDHLKIQTGPKHPQLTTYQDEFRKDSSNINKMFHNLKG